MSVGCFEVEVLSETDFDAKMTRQLAPNQQLEGKPAERSLGVQAQRCRSRVSQENKRLQEILSALDRADPEKGTVIFLYRARETYACRLDGSC